MSKSVVRSVTVSLLVAGSAIVGATTVLAFQRAPAVSPQPGGPAATPRFEADYTIEKEMAGLDRRARVDMLLYKGRFGGGDIASGRRHLDVVAVILPPAR